MDATTTVEKTTTGKKKAPVRHIRKAAVLGSGVMGSAIACHFANIGLEVLLLDIVPFELTEAEKAKGLTKEDPVVRNRIVNESLKECIKGKFSPLYRKSDQKLITTGNFDDDFEKIADCDLILEAVIERLDIKNQIFEKVDKFRKKGSIVASNTSGIPLHMMTEGRSEDFNKNFLGMHFFNPPRYLRLLEIIPTPHTDTDLVDFLMEYGDIHIGKKTVLCKDTPAFIANRVGLYALVKILELVEELELTVEETDKLTGKATGKPNTGTFKLCDLIGNDTALKVKNGLRDNLPDDEAHDLFARETVLEKVVEKGWMGNKTKGGFYKRIKNDDGSRATLSLDLNTLEYREKENVSIPSLTQAKQLDSLSDRLKMFYAAKDKGGELARKSSQALFAYVSNRIPEIADDLYKIDDALKAGFGWEIGPFESWDIIGVEKGLKDAEAAGYKVAKWVHDMLAAGNKSFYKVEDGNRLYYNISAGEYQTVPGTEELIILDNLRHSNKIWGNSGVTILDLGDGVMNIEFHTKMNAIGGEVLQGIHKAIDKAEAEGWNGIVIGNQGEHFSAGANLALILMMGIEQEYDEIEFAMRAFQKTVMRVRYSDIPIVVAPHDFTFGGGCELTLHADRVVASAETYMGLVEVGVGLIPAGCGTKEMTLRMADSFESGDVQLNTLQNTFLTIAQAKVATSAMEAFDNGFLRRGDMVSINKERVIKDAREQVLLLAEAGYSRPVEREDIQVLGRTGLGMINTGAYGFYAGDYISEHDLKIAKKVAWVMCGGDLHGTQKVSEQYLLDLEREAFLSLMGEKKTLERIQHMLKTGRPLRN